MSKEFTIIKTDNDTFIVKAIDLDPLHQSQSLKGFGNIDKVLEEAKQFFKGDDVPF